MLAPFYDTLNPLQTDFNSAMTALRQSIDLLIQACGQPQPPQGLVGQPVVQTALDYTNQADALFASLRQRIAALLPPEGPVNNDTECLFTFRNHSEIVPRIHLNEAKEVTLTAKHFVTGLCFDAGAGQSLSVEMLKVSGNAEPQLTISSFDNPTNFIGSAQIGVGGTDATASPILITQTGRYILILGDLDGAPSGPLQGDIAVLLTDVTATSGVAPAHLAIDPATGNVITVAGGIAPVTPGINSTAVSYPTLNPNVACPSVNFTCDQLTSCDQAYACLRAGNISLDPDGNGIPCQNLCGG